MSGVKMLTANGRWQPKAGFFKLTASSLHTDSRLAAKDPTKRPFADPRGRINESLALWMEDPSQAT